MNKREERDHKFKLLFSTLFYPEEGKQEQLSHYSYSKEEDEDFLLPEKEEEHLSEEEEAFLSQEVMKVLELLPHLDERINAVTEGWTTNRMSKTDLTVLRLALYELEYQEETPDKVVFNEAVEIAKKYGGADSGSFVNGVLARITGKQAEGEEKGKSAKGKSGKSEKKSFHIVKSKAKEEKAPKRG